jgi:hypothetical protein
LRENRGYFANNTADRETKKKGFEIRWIYVQETENKKIDYTVD